MDTSRIAQNLLQKAQHSVEQKAPKMKVDYVQVAIGERQEVDLEGLQKAWRLLRGNYMALAQANLQIDYRHTEYRCEACGERAWSQAESPRCPSCGSKKMNQLSGDELTLLSIEGDESESIEPA